MRSDSNGARRPLISISAATADRLREVREITLNATRDALLGRIDDEIRCFGDTAS
jgi:hypothetical protein